MKRTLSAFVFLFLLASASQAQFAFTPDGNGGPLGPSLTSASGTVKVNEFAVLVASPTISCTALDPLNNNLSAVCTSQFAYATNSKSAKITASLALTSDETDGAAWDDVSIALAVTPAAIFVNEHSGSIGTAAATKTFTANGSSDVITGVRQAAATGDATLTVTLANRYALARELTLELDYTAYP